MNRKAEAGIEARALIDDRNLDKDPHLIIRQFA